LTPLDNNKSFQQIAARFDCNFAAPEWKAGTGIGFLGSGRTGAQFWRIPPTQMR
jgi:hypothetical protein